MRTLPINVNFDPITGPLMAFFQALALAALAIVVQLFAAPLMERTGAHSTGATCCIRRSWPADYCGCPGLADHPGCHDHPDPAQPAGFPGPGTRGTVWLAVPGLDRWAAAGCLAQAVLERSGQRRSGHAGALTALQHAQPDPLPGMGR